jgi:hypothetical protein
MSWRDTTLLQTRIRAAGGSKQAKATLSRWGKRGAFVAWWNRIQREQALDMLHQKPVTSLHPDEPVMNSDGDLVPRYCLE